MSGEFRPTRLARRPDGDPLSRSQFSEICMGGELALPLLNWQTLQTAASYLTQLRWGQGHRRRRRIQ